MKKKPGLAHFYTLWSSLVQNAVLDVNYTQGHSNMHNFGSLFVV